ncbi:transposable element Tc1 transposase [Trichonephila clavipes]|nr:transposable element Tc1 transposase [Trichonephila clavipes]
MEDNVRPHRDNLVDEFMLGEALHKMEWSSRSSDFNPIEQTCFRHSGEGNCNPYPRTLQGLKTAMLNEWNQLSQELFICLISSIK